MARTAKTTDETATEPVGALYTAPATPGTAARTARPGSKLAQVVDLLESEAGATIAEIMAATSWQQHYADAGIMPMWICKPLFLAGTSVLGSA